MATPIPSNVATFSAAEIAEATGGELRGAGSVQVAGVTIDSRTVQPGNLFVALRGEHFDAHAFLEDAVSAGAVALVVARGSKAPVDTCVVEVDDTLVALGAIAKRHRSAWSGILVAITGSAGKTTTKELVAAALGGAGRRVFKTAGNLNNRVGVPMTLLQLAESADVAVIEVGTSLPGEIAMLGEISRPDVAMVTLVSIAHTEGLGSLEAVAVEKTSLFDHVAEGGHLISNGDDPLLQAMAASRKSYQHTTFGFSRGCSVRVSGWSLSAKGTLVTLELPQPLGQIEIDLSLLGESAAVNAAAALAVVLSLELSVTDAGEALSAVQPMQGRMAPVRSSIGALVLDDSYNANPRSTEAALRTASALAKAEGRRLLVALGDMKELGALSTDEHRAVGTQVASAGVGLFIACGEAMREAAETAERGGVSTVAVGRSEEAAKVLLKELDPNDVVLVKGSRSMAMERIVEALVTGEVTS